MLMELSHYLPKEYPIYRNYPELLTYQRDIATVLDYATTLYEQINAFNLAKADKIDADASLLKENIAFCRTLLETLGRAPKVCYDIILDLRKAQNVMQQVYFLYYKYGNRYVGKPSEGGMV